MSGLSFTATGQTLSRTDSNQLAQNAVGLVATFALAADWDGRVITARFGSYDVLVTGGSCIIPWEVLREPSFYTQLTGTKSADDVLTTNQILVEVLHSDSTPGESPVEPSETVYQQLAALILALNAKVDLLEPVTSKTVFAQIAPVSITNTAETSLIGETPMSIAAGSLSVGRMYRLKMLGFLTGSNGVSTTLRIKLDGNTIVQSAGTVPTNLTAAPVMLEFIFTCRTAGASGTIAGGGQSVIAGGQGVSTSYMRGLNFSAGATVDTTQAHTLDVTYQFGTTGQTMLATNATLERLY